MIIIINITLIIITMMPRAPALKPRAAPLWPCAPCALQGTMSRACPWSAGQVRAAHLRPQNRFSLLFQIGAYRRANVLMPELIGLELLDRDLARPGPPPPPLPSEAPQGPWPWWAPAWFELPLPGVATTPDFWHFPQDVRTPPIWLVPEWDGGRDVDPCVLVMIWIEIESGATRCPWVGSC